MQLELASDAPLLLFMLLKERKKKDNKDLAV